MMAKTTWLANGWIATCSAWLISCFPGDSMSGIQIDSPTPGERVSGEVPLVVSYSPPVAYRGWSMSFDEATLGETLERRAPATTDIRLSSWDWPNGPRTLYVEMYGWGWGRRWRDSVEFIVDNPPQRLVRARHPASAKPGDLYRAELEFNLPNLTLQPHAFELPGVKLDAINIEQISPTSFRLEFQLPPSKPLRTKYALELRVSNGERDVIVPTYVQIARR